MKPVATPYVINDAGLIFGQCLQDDDEAPFVADIIGDRERAAFGLLTDQEAATAAFIITACNAHERLVDTLRAIKRNSQPQMPIDDEHDALVGCHCLATNMLALLERGEP